MLLQTLCNDLRLLDQVQPQITPEDFDDADLRAIYTTLLRLVSQGELTVFPRIIDEAGSPGQMAASKQNGDGTRARQPGRNLKDAGGLPRPKCASGRPRQSDSASVEQLDKSVMILLNNNSSYRS